MGIAPKKGKCIDCGSACGEQYLTAKRCKLHYWKHRQDVNAFKQKNKAKVAQKKVHGTYFANQVLQMPAVCEECWNPLPLSPSWMRKACVAHILPKREDYGFPSVAIHPLNRVFLCIDCHTNMDNLGESYVLKMKILPVLRERVEALLPELTERERNRVPEYLLS